MFGKVVRSLCRDRRGLSLVAGAIGVLTGVEHLLSTRTTKPAPVPSAPPAEEPVLASKSRACFKISQTRSELGYVYWVLHHYGANPSYALFDTWQEAMDEAARRIAATQPVRVPA
jgi:hypothetical protein